MNTVVKFISTTEKKLADLEILNGQLIFVEDTRRVYMDLHNQRTQYNNIIYLSTENQRLSMSTPVAAFYFCYETNIVWRYDDTIQEWIQITGKPQQSVVFLDEEDFPAKGNPSCIYISGVDIYRWRDGEYQIIGSSYWKKLE